MFLSSSSNGEAPIKRKLGESLRGLFSKEFLSVSKESSFSNFVKTEALELGDL